MKIYIHKSVLILFILFSILFIAHASATTINHLDIPGVYDNVGGDSDFGQTFVAQDNLLSGFQVYIGDPTRPENTLVNELIGPADLILYNATNLLSPFEIARDTVVNSGSIVNGLSTFLFNAPVATEIGTKYFFIILADDNYGIGLQAQYVSTYGYGAEARINENTLEITEHELERDLSFSVLSPSAQPVPEPSTMLLLGTGLIGLAGWGRKKFKKN